MSKKSTKREAAMLRKHRESQKSRFNFEEITTHDFNKQIDIWPLLASLFNRKGGLS